MIVKSKQIIKSLLVFITLFHVLLSLHTLQQQSTQLKTLKEQQKYLGQQVGIILENNKFVNDNLAQASSNQEQIALLQDAIKGQRQKIFDIKNKIIYPFDQSETACKQLTQKQKKTIQNQLIDVRADLKNLQNISDKMNKANKEIIQIDQDIQKQLILLNQMEQTLKVQCKVNLSPSIFQTNLNSKNWILGPQTMDDLKQEYAQRAMIFHNVTNCPLQTPFFDPKSQSCILCPTQNPIFNMYTKECTQCQDSQDLDDKKRQCKQKVHYTNFSSVINWNLEGGQLPNIDPNLTACPKQKPYFNGVLCITCQIPLYWSVSANLCKQCNKGFSFDQNTKKCQANIRNQLTILQNNQWIAKNITKVLEDRQKILELNKTKGVYHYCPSTMQPYYDGTTCIYCKYFDMDTKKCVQLPDKLVYDQNMKMFVAPQQSKQTYPKATNYISSKALNDTSLTNCNETFPYWDGIACVKCVSPFIIFNIDEKKCSLCNADEIYVQKNHTCQPRVKIHISQNQDRLLATNKVSILAYKNSLIKLINDNPEAIVYPCPQPKQYANVTTCFFCQSNQYFNVQTLACTICDGKYIDTNKTCKQNEYIFTNLKAPKITDFGSLTVQNQTNRINDFIKNRTLSKICPIDKPYAIQNTTCGTCPDLFSYSTLKCTTCQQFKIYVSTSKSCEQAKMLVNLTDSSKVLLQKDKTIKDYKTSQLAVKAQFPELAKECPGDKPYTSDRQSCFNCPNQRPYFNYTTKQCQNCQEGYVFDSKTQQCRQVYYVTLINNQTTLKMRGYDNYNIQNFKSEQALIIAQQQYKNCTSDQPFGTSDGCQQCYDPTPYFDIKNKKCSAIQYFTNFSSFGQNYLLTTSKTLDDYKRDQQQFKTSANTLTAECPVDKPYTSDRNSCFSCTSPDFLYNPETKTCQRCQDGMAFVSSSKSCSKKFYITNFTSQTSPFMLGHPDYTITDFQTQQKRIMAQSPYQNCTNDMPYGTIDGCRKCVDPLPYFDIKSRVCAQVKMLTNFDKLGTQVIKNGSKSVSDYKLDEDNFQKSTSYLTLVCNASTPYTSDRSKCFNCSTPPKVLFNLDTKQCEQCNDGQSFVSSTNQCQSTVYVSLINNQTSKNLLQSNKNYSITNFTNDQTAKLNQPATLTCTADKPYGSLIDCIACNSTNPYFDVSLKKCVACGSGSQFYNDSNQCLTPVYLTNFSNPNIKEDGSYTVDTAKAAQTQRTLAQGAKPIQCPSTTPFATLSSCISCNDSKKPYFNIKSMTCQGCLDFYQYFENNNCEDNIILTNTQSMIGYIEIDNYTKYNVQKQNNFTFIQNKHVVDCPSSTPFYDGTQCIACPDSQPIFNLKDKVCEYLDSLMKTNVDAMKFYIQQGSQTKTALQNQITTLKPKLKIQLCPSSAPYLSGDKCISCPDTAKYFNLGTQVCQTCGASDRCFG